MPPPLDLLTPNEIHAYVEQVCADLAAAGMSDAARRLKDVQSQAFTTGSEWRGELRHAARAIRSQERLPPRRRRISVCPGCGERSQHPEQAWCASCGHPLSGRSRYCRPLPSEGWFCGRCGKALPDGGLG